MEVYGQTNDILVRKLNLGDAEKFLELMRECGTAEDYTVEDIKNVLNHRENRGHMQCTITSPDGNTIYGFCTLFNPAGKKEELCIGFFEKYSVNDYKQQTMSIMRK